MSQPERAILVSETDAKNQIHSVLRDIRHHGHPAAMKRLGERSRATAERA